MDLNLKVIEEFPNYSISSCGRVFNRKRELKQKTQHQGYKQICLCKNGKSKMFSVHRLVGKEFIENPDNLPEVDHINRIKDDNRVENLRWISRSDNQQNKGDYKTNTSGHKYICYNKSKNSWKFEKTIDKKTYLKLSKDINELIKYKEEFLKNLSHPGSPEEHHSES